MDKEGESMNFKQGKGRKPLAVLILLLLLLTGAWYADGVPEPPVVLQKEAVKDSGHEPLKVKGLAEANNSSPLRNPFSLLHETEAEAAGGLVSVQEGTASGTDVEKKTAPVVTSRQQPPAVKERGNDIALCGIAEGDGKRLALLRVDGMTVTAAAGETVKGWRVTAIGRSAVVVARDGQERSLDITSGGEGSREQ